MIPYDPKDAKTTWPDGIYKATLESVSEKTSKNGNDMYVIEMEVYDGAKHQRIADYVVLPTFAWRLKRIAVALGVGDVFATGTFDPAEYVTRSLKVELMTKEADGKYEERNAVRSYLPADVPPREQEPPTPEDEDLPF